MVCGEYNELQVEYIKELLNMQNRRAELEKTESTCGPIKEIATREVEWAVRR